MKSPTESREETHESLTESREETHESLTESREETHESLTESREETRESLTESREETHESLTEYSLTSTNGEKMIYVNDGSSGIIMFTTNSNMSYVCQSDVEIFCDGTFKYCPRF